MGQTAAHQQHAYGGAHGVRNYVRNARTPRWQEALQDFEREANRRTQDYRYECSTLSGVVAIEVGTNEETERQKACDIQGDIPKIGNA